MALCSNCGANIGVLSVYGPNGTLCKSCNINRLKEDKDPKVKLRKEQKEAEKAAIDGVMLTTETYPADLKIGRRIEVVTAECAFGMNMFKDLFAGVRDIVGGRSEAVQKTLRDTRRVALFELKKEAHSVGADAVIGVDLDYVELSNLGNMVLLVASGTAVTLVKN